MKATHAWEEGENRDLDDILYDMLLDSDTFSCPAPRVISNSENEAPNGEGKLILMEI